MKKILRNLADSFCLYLLAALNIIHAIQNQTFDWLLWVSVALTILSLALTVICTMQEDKKC